MSNIILYSFRRCPFAMRVRMALHEKGLSFETREEDLKNLSPAVRQLHPQAKVPVLLHGDRVLYESSIITEYIEERFPAPIPLMPRDAGEKAEVRLWTHWCNVVFKLDIDRLKYGKARFPEAECVGVEEWVTRHLERLESRLKEADWLVGGTFSLADIHVFPFSRQLSRITPTPEFLSDFPLALNWIERVSNRPSFLRSMEKANSTSPPSSKA